MRIAHISDFHLPGKPGQSAHGAFPDANLREAAGLLKQQAPKADLIVLGGDLLEEGHKGNYEPIADLFKEIEAPLRIVLGNHDDLKALQKSSLVQQADRYPGYDSCDHGGVHLIFLNTATAGKPGGSLEGKQLIWMSEDLYENHGKPVLIFMHHPPIDCGIPWLDKIKLENADAFWDIVPPYAKNVMGVFFAHLHIQLSTVVRGVLVASPPAVGFQFSANDNAPKEEVSGDQPGFNLIDVNDWNVRLRTVRFDPASAPAGGRKAPPQEQGSGPPTEAGGEGGGA
jgi:Icc protein